MAELKAIISGGFNGPYASVLLQLKSLEDLQLKLT